MHGACHCPSVGLWGIRCYRLSTLSSKKKWKKLCRFSKENFSGQEIFKGFSIDRLSQMTLALQIFLRKTTFKKDKMGSHECLYLLFIDLKHSPSNVYSILLVAYDTTTKCVERVRHSQNLLTLLKHCQASRRLSIKCMEKGELSDHLFGNFIFFRKDLSFVVKFVNSSKSETQHVLHKIYSHVIEIPPSKSKTQHGVHRA